MKENYYIIDTIDRYNKWYSKETLHPLITVLNHNTVPDWMNGATLRYGVYGLFLKQGDGCSIRYGRESYDYQEGTVVSFAPGQTAPAILATLLKKKPAQRRRVTFKMQ